MLAVSKLPTTFRAEAVNTACYLQNRVLVTKPHNKTPYELFLGRKPALGFMKPFGCPVIILNTIDHLGKFDGKSDEGFFVGYSINRSGPNWLFDIDALTKSMNYKPVVAGNQFNGNAGTKASDNAGTKACDDTGKARMETVPSKDYILLPLWIDAPPFSQSSKSSPDGKFDGKTDEGFFVRYSINSKAFRVFNNRTRIVKESLHVQFSENKPNIAGSGPNWLFDINALTKSMNYKLVVAKNQSNGNAGTKASNNAGTKACDDAGKARIETVPGKDYILLPLWTADPPFSQSSKSYPDAGFKPSGDDGKKVDENPRKEGESNDQEKEDKVNNTNNVNAASTNKVNAVGRKISIELPLDPNMPPLEDIVYSDDEDVGATANMNNLDEFISVSPIPTTGVHKDHPVEQIIRENYRRLEFSTLNNTGVWLKGLTTRRRD
ncbi:ribonuclease H-like domain-containing protein [Tanacetum coccineum]